MTLFDGSGRSLERASKIASGGEGTVYEVAGKPDVVAKLYSEPPSRDRVSKLRAMVANSAPQLFEFSAWPIDIVADRPNGSVRGFTMRFIKGHREIHDLYSPKYRGMHFPQAHWGFLVLAAENMCRAVSAIHSQHHVIGDVNNSSVVVSSKATAMLIDCDSFQVVINGVRYPCDVGVPSYTPPELQGMPFAGLVRTQNHDAFGIAVLVFQLLFMGRHPFSGEYLGPGEKDLTQKIKECRFAFGPGATARQMRQPPNTPPLDIVTMPIVRLFERAFAERSCSGGRPTAAEWVDALSHLRGALKRCHIQPVHMFAHGLTACPWCEIERHTPVTMFVVQLPPTQSLHVTINLDSCWREITLVPSVAPAPLIRVSRVRASDSAAVRAGAWRRGRIIGTLVLGGATVLTLFLLQVLSPTVAFWLAVIVLVIGGNIGGEKKQDLLQKLQDRVRNSEETYGEIKRAWDTEASEKRFKDKLAELDRYRRELPTLSKEREERFARLKATVRESQLHRYLDHFRIDRAGISGIGPGRSATLASYGIETAADVEMNRVLSVHGIGWTYANSLVNWRKRKEAGFVFDSSKGVDPVDVRALDSELQQRLQRGENELRAGADSLRKFAESIGAARTQLRPKYETALANLEQAKANLRAL